MPPRARPAPFCVEQGALFGGERGSGAHKSHIYAITWPLTCNFVGQIKNFTGLMRYIITGFWPLWALLALLAACTPSEEKAAAAATENGQALFVELSAERTGLEFANLLKADEGFDVFRYRNYYNGGGVAIGDINNDGLPDVYLIANRGSNRLFLNKGDFKFEDISASAGVAGSRAWSTGVAMADVNGDGLLDIYVCNSGDIDGDGRTNELFINNGDMTFTERAAEYGLADEGYSTHAVFFDFDKDGDLDCYMLNNSFRPISTLGYKNLRHQRDTKGGDKLYRNDNGKFVDISEQAGIYGSVIGFGLGITVGDVDMDGWPDLYISNDFYERDYLYINQRDGTFRESLTSAMGHTSHFSMGADIGDINNDGYPEIFVTDMLPETLARTKETTSFMTYDEEVLRLDNDFYYQFMRNTLQLNHGDGTFSEVGQLAGVEATDWSWGALVADLDNNGHKDIFVCNGIYKDLTNQDFVNFLASEENIKAAQRGEAVDFKKYIEMMPSTKIGNYAFSNEGRFPFRDVSAQWGFTAKTHSNGAAYGDLDGDGDLDLIINNLNSDLMVYENKTNEQLKNKFLKFNIKGDQKNRFGIGTKIVVYSGEEIIYYEHTPTKGFQSSMDYVPVIGLGQRPGVDSVHALSAYGQLVTFGSDVALNTTHDIDFSSVPAGTAWALPKRFKGPALLSSNNAPLGKIAPVHTENAFIDFDRDKLLYHGLSSEGPKIALGDVDGDGTADFYLCGAHQSPGQLWVYSPKTQTFRPQPIADFIADKDFEDTDALFVDIDGDGDLDLYVASGSNELLYSPDALQDRVYLNESTKGNIKFVRQENALPRLRRATSSVTTLDYDGDGDMDLLVGTLLADGGYGLPASSFLLENNGAGKYTDVTRLKAPYLKDIGMVSATLSTDLNGDGRPDLVLAGEWMPVTIYLNEGGRFGQPKTIPQSTGLWKTLATADLNGDGRPDLVGGNLGLNSRFRASPQDPMMLYVKDFDKNGSAEQIFCLSKGGQAYPMALKQDLSKVLPLINKRFTTYDAYRDKTAAEVFGAEELASAQSWAADHFASTAFLQAANGTWQSVTLPDAAQVSPVYAICIRDVNADGHPDILLGGNLWACKPEIGRYDASFGTLLLNDGKGQFRNAPSRESGLKIWGEVRDIQSTMLPNGRPYLLIALNNGPVRGYTLRE